ncbi:ATP-dependent RNA helicase DDX42 isoform X1 [Octopus sinensis]|uniref:ATP-dependent RNA helicase DDX42 n=1 Tax=Octopus sinensis TaxID=2607531 RepID=A0A6P7SJM3_9MOLL|nr:ATP-dependent RNA helicase DDX42 isoform X1 [Octopus sinensis]XP_036363815.1 ATP-dependent RNA helicase DDX42 isoform X1 [Octopus sinensis]
MDRRRYLNFSKADGKSDVTGSNSLKFNKGGDGRPRGFGFQGFAINKKPAEPQNVKPPGTETLGFTPGSTLFPGRSYGFHTNIGKKRVKSEEEYFDDDDDENLDLEYQPAPGSPGVDKEEGDDNSDSDDPLDAFMANIEKEVKDQDNKMKKETPKTDKGVREDIEQEDDQESYFRYMEENPTAGLLKDDEEIEVEYDTEGNAIIPEKMKSIDPLPPVDHTEITYMDFEKNFYEEHEEIIKLSDEQLDELQQKLGIKVTGLCPPRPVSSFAHFGFDEGLMNIIRKSEYTQPTPIQAQGVPVALSGRDIIGIAKTGSGKTAAFIWPMLIHLMDQNELEEGDGPIGLILAPTRELSQQIYHEAKKFGKVYNIRVVCAYGGGSLWEQSKACQEGAEVIVATPGRLIDLVKKKATNLRRVTYLVFDEADRMFDMGFESQVRSIANHVRPDRQTLLFSATFRKKVERLARDILTDPIRVIQGELGEANQDVTQLVDVLPTAPIKWRWLLKRLVEFTSLGSILIFVTRKSNAEELVSNLKSKDFEVGLLHGDMEQAERNKVITMFKKKEVLILVATDVASRGLDIPSIKTVVNYDVARDIDTHTHRIGRTGRAGEKGYAYTLVNEKDKDFAGHLVRNLESSNQHVPQSLLDLAMQNSWFRKSRFKQGKGKKVNTMGKVFGYRERPGLGAENSSSVQESSFSGFRPATSTASLALSSRPQSDRLAAIKSAFAAQFKSNFVAASEENNTQLMHQPKISENTELQPDSKRRKKSRWD